MKKMTPDEAWDFSQDRSVWKDYKSIDEYIEDIVTILANSTWHYSEEMARDIVKERKALVEHYYEQQKPADRQLRPHQRCCSIQQILPLR